MYIIAAKDSIASFYRSFDAGINWTNIPTTMGMIKQAWWNLVCKVHPTNAKMVYIASVEPYFSQNAGTSFDKIGDWRSYKMNEISPIHSDIHSIHFEPRSSKNAIWTSDGGIFKYDTMNIYSGRSFLFTPRNLSYITTQYCSVALSPQANSNIMLGGLQDNGTHLFQNSGLNSVRRVGSGDGGYCHLSKYAYFQIISAQYNKNLFSTDSGKNFNGIPNENNTGVHFVNPTIWDDDSSILYSVCKGGYNRNKFLSNRQWKNKYIPIRGMNRTATVIKLDKNIRNKLWMVLSDSVYIFRNGQDTPRISLLVVKNYTPGSVASDIDIDKNDSNHILVTYSNFTSNNLIETRDGGVTWTVIDGNLPDMPIYQGMFHPFNSNQIIIGTELGIFETNQSSCSNTTWQPCGKEFPNVKVTMLKFRPSDSTLAAATFGRGIWTIKINGTTPCNPPYCLTNNAITNSTANLSFGNNSSSAITIEYKKSSDVKYTVFDSNSRASNVVLRGLSSNTDYVWRAKANCSRFYTYGNPFKTCANPPTKLLFISDGTQGGRATWTKATNATSYQFSYRRWDSSAWKSSPITTDSFQTLLSIFSPSSNVKYYFRVESFSNTCSTPSILIDSFSSYPCIPPTVNMTNITSTHSEATLKLKIPTTTNFFKVDCISLNTAAPYSFNNIYGGSMMSPDFFYQRDSLVMKIKSLSPTTTYQLNISSVCDPWDTEQYNQLSLSVPIKFTTRSACKKVENLNYNWSNQNNLLNINWKDFRIGGNERYYVQYKLQTANIWTSIGSQVDANGQYVPGGSGTDFSTKLDVIPTNGTYLLKVYPSCSSDSSIIDTFYMPLYNNVLCDTPRGISASNLLRSGVTISWTQQSFALNYKIQYRRQVSSGTAENWIETPNIFARNYKLTSLQPNTNYEYRVMVICRASNSSYTSIYRFRTSP